MRFLPPPSPSARMEDNDERVPLLQSESEPIRFKQKPNPLPWPQLSVVLFVKTCDALATQSIQPYINKLVGGLDIIGGDERKVGYYVGLIESFYFVALGITVLHWNKLSDRLGRKPLLLMGMCGSMASMLCFGLSRTFWGLVVSRSLWGLLDGNVGVMQSVVGEITDSTNRARGFGLIFVLWAVGGSLGPLIGGSLSNPSDRFPTIFGGEFWKQQPYFLPCLAVAIIILISFLVTLFYFKESATSLSHPGEASEGITFASSTNKPIPLRQLLTYPVIISVANLVYLEFLSSSHAALVPLFFAMPIKIGGLGFDPRHIGYVLGVYRAVTAIFMATYFSKIVHHLGERGTYILSMASFHLLWVLFPVMNLCARQYGISTSVWTGIVLWAVPTTSTDMAFSCIFVFLTAAAPNRRSLGAIHGLSQTAVSIARIIAPSLSTSLFSFSVERNLLGGYAVYAVYLFLSSFAVWVAMKLPHGVRPAWEGEDESPSCDNSNGRGVAHRTV